MDLDEVGLKEVGLNEAGLNEAGLREVHWNLWRHLEHKNDLRLWLFEQDVAPSISHDQKGLSVRREWALGVV